MKRVKEYKQLLPKTLIYRPEVDGLRAIAVVSVILYHAQILIFGRDWFEGGFIGVDIFFVISGYLITRIILSELETTGSFSFLNFYERRARRILPMLFFVIFVSIPFAWERLLPSDFVEYAESILASLFFGSNFFFYFSTTEYGADSALLKPFLHTWSLAVEEQFYLVFPILAIVAFKFFRKHFLTILIGLSLLSLQFAELMEVRNADLNFYLPFSRFWELAVGSMLAYRELYYKPSNEGVASKSLPMIGLYLIAYSILFFDAKTPHPSFHTLIPIIGVALIIGFSSKDELVGKVLGSKPFVWGGLISYSAYLWHFPIFSFQRMAGELNNYDKLNLIILTLFLSCFSYFIIERPFRRTINTNIFVLILTLCLALIAIGFAVVKQTDGLKFRYKYQMNLNLDYNGYAQDHLDFARKIQGLSNFDNGSINILFIGNSHSRDLQSAFYQNKQRLKGFSLRRGAIGQISCFDPQSQSDEVRAVKEDFYSSGDYQKAQIIIISTQFREKQSCLRRKEVLNDLDGLRSVIERSLLDGKKVVVFGGNPEFKQYERRPLLDYMLRELSDDHGGIENVNIDEFNALIDGLDKKVYADINRKVLGLNLKVKSIADELGVLFVSKYGLICSDLTKSCLVLTPTGDKIFWDKSHFSINGAQYIGSILLTDEFISSLRNLSQN